MDFWDIFEIKKFKQISNKLLWKLFSLEPFGYKKGVEESLATSSINKLKILIAVNFFFILILLLSVPLQKHT